MKRIALFSTLVVSLAPCFGQSGACKPVAEAFEKYLNTPSHLYSTRSSPMKAGTENTEAIYTETDMYVMTRGKWMRSPITMQEMRKDRTEQNGSIVNCRMLRSEPVDGEAATVYSTTQSREGTKSDSIVWISNSRGLPLRQEMDIDVGGRAGKFHTVVRFDYRNVTPPAGVH